MKTQEIIRCVEQSLKIVSRMSESRVLLHLIGELAERVAELESREEVRERIEPIVEGKKPAQRYRRKRVAP